MREFKLKRKNTFISPGVSTKESNSNFRESLNYCTLFEFPEEYEIPVGVVTTTSPICNYFNGIASWEDIVVTFWNSISNENCSKLLTILNTTSTSKLFKIETVNNGLVNSTYLIQGFINEMNYSEIINENHINLKIKITINTFEIR